MNRWKLALIPAVALAAVCGACVSSRGDAQAGAGLAPVLSAADWINGRPAASELNGKVVVLDVFTVDCYNCQNVVPALRKLYALDRGQGLEVVGIHAPETPAERQRDYVTDSLERQGIVWPVAVDNGFALWKAYGVDAWPTQLFFDRHGRLRKTIVGDSQDDAVRSTVESLLAER